LFYQLLGEYFKALSWIFGIWFVPYMKLKQWIIFDCLFYSLFVFGFLALLNYSDIGVEAVSVAYFVGYFIYFLVIFFYTRSRLNFVFARHHLFTLLFSSFIIFFMFIISRVSVMYGFILFVPVISLWLFFVVKKQDVIAVKKILLKKFSG
jgi:hypothetical protein